MGRGVLDEIRLAVSSIVEVGMTRGSLLKSFYFFKKNLFN